MQTRHISSMILSAALIAGAGASEGLTIITRAQNATTTARTQTEASPIQRLDVMRSQLEAMRRSLQSAVQALGGTPKDKAKKNDKGQDAAASSATNSSTDEARQRLRGLDQEANSILSEVNDLHSKQERAERYDASRLDKLEASIADLNTRVDAGLRATASERGNATTNIAAGKDSSNGKKKKGRFFGLLGGGGKDKFEELKGAPAAGRDRQLFETAAHEVRKGRQQTGRDLFNVIITTYPDSPYLPAAKLAIADSFYLEGETSSLIQAAAAYQDWLTFFPTHPLADEVMLKSAECEMRQMGLPDRDISHARKAEVKLKAILQQFPNTTLRAQIQERLNQVQENLAMHNLQVARLYNQRSNEGKGGLKGAESRLREIVEKYPNFTYMDEVLFRLGTLYAQEEEPDEAAKLYQQVARDYPKSEYADKARDQLDIIGAAKPDADPIKDKLAAPPRPTFREKVFTEVLGSVQVTVDKDGVLISRNNEDTDLLAEAIKNGGQLPAKTPDAITNQRRPPARVPVSPSVNQASPANSAAPNNADSNNTLKFQPTQPGAPTEPGTNARPQSLAPQTVAPTAAPSTNAPKTSTSSPATTPTGTTPPQF